MGKNRNEKVMGCEKITLLTLLHAYTRTNMHTRAHTHAHKDYQDIYLVYTSTHASNTDTPRSRILVIQNPCIAADSVSPSYIYINMYF